VAGVEITSQSEFGVVSHADRLLLGLEPEQGRDGAEGFLAGHLHLRRDVAQHGGLEEIAAELLATGDERSALGQGILDMLANLVDRSAIDERAGGGAVLRAVADLEAADSLGELLREGVIDAVLDQDA